MLNNVFFLNLVFTQFDCKSKESREGRGFFSIKRGGGGGVVEKGFAMVPISTAIGLAQDISIQVLTIWGRLMKGRMALTQD